MMSNKEIFDLLGIEKENQRNSKYLIDEFKSLVKTGYRPENIYLKCDYGIYCDGQVALETNNLIALI